MKKFSTFLLVLAIFSIASKAQNLSLSNADGPIAPGSTISVTGAINGDIPAYIYITNSSNNNIAIKVRKYENYVVTGTENSFCFNGMCFESTMYLSPTTLNIAANTTNQNGFHGTYSPFGNLGTTSITYKIFNNADSTDNVMVTVNYIGTPDGITEKNNNYFTNFYKNSSGQYVLSYNLEKNSESKLVISNILGQKIKVIDLIDKTSNITVDLNDLNSGIYIYSVINDQKLLITKKFIKD